MKQKRLMLLGGLRYLIPVIDQCHRMGIHVITADYLPDNIAHQHSDEYCNISIVDKDAVLEAAIRCKIDGIISFAVDPGVVSAAYVAERMGLPFQCSYAAACILQNKVLFRDFLRKNGFSCPESQGYSSLSDALADRDRFSWPVIVKPADSAGSKGVSKVCSPDQLENAFGTAFSYSSSKQVIIEDYLDKVGEQSSADIFVMDGKLVYPVFSDQLFDLDASNPYTPSMEIWPSSMDRNNQKTLSEDLQRLITLLDIRSGLFNVETRICSDGKAYIMEFSPRGGGNRIAEIQSLATGAPLIENEIRMALGMPLLHLEKPSYRGIWVNLILHTNRNGIFKGVQISPSFRQYIKFEDYCVTPGSVVNGFSGAHTSIGSMFLQFKDREDFEARIDDLSNAVRVIVHQGVSEG